ncbi:hypothetical protein [Rhizorhabdus argentea]|uniref:hypothetical protein n=1 Tax=Rhizorhabdus argentea TaxID=1387174 RepID=UPI0030EC3B0B
MAAYRAASRSAPPPRRTAKLTAAVETMMRGTAFLYARAAALEQDGISSAAHRNTVLGNSLRELDLFLNILLDELAISSGLSGQTLRIFTRRRSATAKLAAYPALFGHRIDDRTRLLVLAERRGALLSSAIRSGRQCDAKLLSGLPVAAAPASLDLQSVTIYYGRLATRIIRHVERIRTARSSGRRRFSAVVKAAR